MSDRELLRARFDAFSVRPFPRGDDLPADVRAEVALYDSRVAGAISTLLAGGTVQANALSPDLSLEARVSEADAGGGGVFTRYLAELRRLLELAAVVRGGAEAPST